MIVCHLPYLHMDIAVKASVDGGPSGKTAPSTSFWQAEKNLCKLLLIVQPIAVMKKRTREVVLVRICRGLVPLLLLFLLFLGCNSGGGEDDDLADQDDDAVLPVHIGSPQQDDDLVDDDVVGDDDTYTCNGENEISFDLTPKQRNVPYPSPVYMPQAQNSPTGYQVNVRGEMPEYLKPIWLAGRIFLGGLNELNGFGTSTPVWFHANEAPNPRLFPDAEDPNLEDSIFCMVLEDEDHPHYGETWPLEVSYLPDVELIQIVPHLPFAQNTTYACVVTDRVHTSYDYCYSPPAHLRYLMSPEPDPHHPDAALLEPFRQQYQPYFAKLFGQTGINRYQVAGVTFFHTQWIARHLQVMRGQIEQAMNISQPVAGPWRWESKDVDQPHVDSVWEAKYETPTWLRNGVFALDENGDPTPADMERVTVRLVLPKEGAPPFPVVIYAHGLQGDRFQGDPMSRVQAEHGLATVSIDWVYHGARSSGLENLPERISYIKRFLQFSPLLGARRMRDNYAQCVADIMWLRHLIEGLDELDLYPFASGGDGIPDLDTSRIMYTGMSMGAALGTILAAVEPEIDTYLLMAGAANWRKNVIEFEEGSFIGDVIRWFHGVLNRLFGFERESDMDLFYQLQLAISDAADPYNWARYVLQEPLVDRGGRQLNILHQMVANDDVVGLMGGAELARALDLTLLRPYIWPIDDVDVADAPFDGPATFQYDCTDHTFMIMREHEFFAAGNRQASEFFRTARENDRATIINPFE